MQKRPLLRRIPLRTLLLVFLVAYGIVPLSIATVITVLQQRESMETQERIVLAHRVEAQSAVVSQRLGSARERLRGLLDALSAGAMMDLGRAEREGWLELSLNRFLDRSPDLLATRVDLPRDGRELVAAPPEFAEMLTFDVPTGLPSGEVSLQIVDLPNGEAGVLVAMAALGDDGLPSVGVRSVIALPLEAPGDSEVFLIDRDGGLLWSSAPGNTRQESGLLSSQLLKDFVANPTVFVSGYAVDGDGGERPMIAQVSPVAGTRWGIVVQQPKAVAFGAARRWAQTAALAAGLMVVLALVFAVGSSQWIAEPVRLLAARSGEIASGQLGGRVSGTAVGRELSDLAESFNSMSARLENYIGRLRNAAQTNHELFIGSIRALLAAVEAKEPYIRGHSERVARFSRSVAMKLGLTSDQLEEIWVAGLMHDIGKIGIEDRILNKGDVLTPEEFDRMKMHTTVGAEILSSIDQLMYCVPTARSHHERWNGTGYPDALAGQQIPLSARIVAVADSFDAMTTQRVYQDPISGEEALSWIRSESGKGFDPEVVAAFIQAYDDGEVVPPPVLREAPWGTATVSANLHT